MDKNYEAGYQSVAEEYYDTERHPTCANFREASKIFLSRWIDEFPKDRMLLEIGPGKSLIAEIFAEIKSHAISNILLVDSSISMLRHSNSWISSGASPIIGEAESLPISSRSISGIVSSLGDPYNTEAFWEEIGRVSKTGTVVLYTTPSFDWSCNFRSSDKDEGQYSAKFTLRDSRVVYVPSFIYDTKYQADMMTNYGFHLEQVEEITISDIMIPPFSPKLCPERGVNASIVTGYLARKTE